MYVYTHLDPRVIRMCAKAIERALFPRHRELRSDSRKFIKAKAVTAAKLREEMGR